MRRGWFYKKTEMLGTVDRRFGSMKLGGYYWSMSGTEEAGNDGVIIRVLRVWKAMLLVGWPDGDAPEAPTADDVVDRMKKECASISQILQDWSFEPQFLTVDGKDAGLK